MRISDWSSDVCSYDDPHEMPGAVHPLVRRHPATGRKALYLGRRRNAFVMELPVAESNALLDYLWEHTMEPAIEWYQKWQGGDGGILDNQCGQQCGATAGRGTGGQDEYKT